MSVDTVASPWSTNMEFSVRIVAFSSEIAAEFRPGLAPTGSQSRKVSTLWLVPAAQVFRNGSIHGIQFKKLENPTAFGFAPAAGS